MTYHVRCHPGIVCWTCIWTDTMILHSLGYRTDLIFASFDGLIIDRGDYLVIQTPSNPNYYWGNFLLFAQPPAPGDFTLWRNRFAAEIGTPPEVRHQAFGWDSAQGVAGDVEPFLSAGFRLTQSDVLVAGEVSPPPNPPSDVTARPLQSEEEWRMAMENQVRCREPSHGEAEYRHFRRRQMARYRSMSEAGLGSWYGAFLGSLLVADLGIYHDGELGRYQSVSTHPAHRRRGIASKLVYTAAQHAREQFGIDKLVIVADRDSDAGRLYRSLGFRMAEHQIGLAWWRGLTKQ
jgi:GNAT superfamily N-acetyltransferase